jgi:membrane protease YdiL (CAAX protease family)
MVALGFGLQHLALPLLDAQRSLARFLTTLIVGLALNALYLRLGRLLPLVVAHWRWMFSCSGCCR